MFAAPTGWAPPRRARDQRLDRLAGLEAPVTDQRRGERIDYRSFDADHRIDPLADRRVLLEEARIDEVHAAGPGRRSVDHHDLAVHAKIGAADQGSQQPDREGRLKLDTGVAQPLRLAALPPRPGAQGIDQQEAAHAATGGADHRLKDVVRRAAFVPDIKFHQHAGPGRIDIANERGEDLLRVGEQLEPVAADGSAAHQRSPETVHRLCRSGKSWPVDCGKILRNSGLGDLAEASAQFTDAA